MRPQKGRYGVEYAGGFVAGRGRLLSGSDFWLDSKELVVCHS